MLTFIVALLFAGVVLFDFVPQIKRAGAFKKDSAVYLALLIVSFAVLMLFSFRVVVPSPSFIIKDIISTLFNVN